MVAMREMAPRDSEISLVIFFSSGFGDLLGSEEQNCKFKHFHLVIEVGIEALEKTRVRMKIEIVCFKS